MRRNKLDQAGGFHSMSNDTGNSRPERRSKEAWVPAHQSCAHKGVGRHTDHPRVGFQHCEESARSMTMGVVRPVKVAIAIPTTCTQGSTAELHPDEYCDSRTAQKPRGQPRGRSGHARKAETTPHSPETMPPRMCMAYPQR